MINFRIIARAFSLLLIVEGLFMLASGGVSFLYHEHAARSFLYSAVITIITGVLVFTPLRNTERIYGNKEGYIIVTGIWLIFSLFSTLPFLLSKTIPNFGDAFFESMSGFTTTGATILPDVEIIPNGILFWRSLTQWLGGLGIIFISLSIIPVFKSFNIQIAAIEFTGQQNDKIQPRIKDAAKRLVGIYLMLTLIEIGLLIAGGMPFFDAICHSFSTLSTGGFSTHNYGIAAFATPYNMIIITIFMFIAGTNMTLIYFGLKGNFKKVFGNNEFIFYTLTIFVFVFFVSAILYIKSDFPLGKAILDGAFHVISIITTTGFYTQHHNLWGNTILIIFFILMFTGGTSGSTSGGIKIVRLLLITKNSRQEMKRIIHPDGFIPVRLDKRIVPQSTIYNLLVFITLYFIVMCIGAFIISLMGYDIITSFSTSASMLGNIGPGLGTFGPFTNYSAIPMAGKWLFSIMMLLGRLELLTVMILFSRNFYRN
jgi:trk system potassium uptake protein TrkH